MVVLEKKVNGRWMLGIMLSLGSSLFDSEEEAEKAAEDLGFSTCDEIQEYRVRDAVVRSPGHERGIDLQPSETVLRFLGPGSLRDFEGVNRSDDEEPDALETVDREEGEAMTPLKILECLLDGQKLYVLDTGSHGQSHVEDEDHAHYGEPTWTWWRLYLK